MMEKLLTFVVCACVLVSISVAEASQPQSQPEIDTDISLLVFSKTDGWRHDSIEPGIEAVKKLGDEQGFAVYATEDAGYFTEENLSNYDAVLFLNTSETIFEDHHREIFKQYIQNGGGFVGTHSAADTEYDWPWYGELVGAWFESHPHVQIAEINVVDPDHVSTQMIPGSWTKEDEWYNFQRLPVHVEVLLELNTDSFEGSEHPGYHPIAWYHEFDGGRAFYTGMGHTVDTWSDPLFLEHLWGGIQYSMGLSD